MKPNMTKLNPTNYSPLLITESLYWHIDLIVGPWLSSEAQRPPVDSDGKLLSMVGHLPSQAQHGAARRSMALLESLGVRPKRRVAVASLY